jgi:hypothetical protein
MSMAQGSAVSDLIEVRAPSWPMSPKRLGMPRALLQVNDASGPDHRRAGGTPRRSTTSASSGATRKSHGPSATDMLVADHLARGHNPITGSAVEAAAGLGTAITRRDVRERPPRATGCAANW